MNFSKEEFDVMVEELLCSDPISFDMLCNLAEKTLKSKVKAWCQAFCVVLSSDIKVYKILTWLAQFIFIVDYDATKINSNKKIIELFENKTLFEMYTMLRVFTSQIEWIEISESQHKKIMSDLQEPWDEKRVYGEICYSEFFMKVNGEKSGKKSISDWMNRMSNMLCRKIGNQKYPTKSREEKE